jgi:hypothetical protein
METVRAFLYLAWTWNDNSNLQKPQPDVNNYKFSSSLTDKLLLPYKD